MVAVATLGLEMRETLLKGQAEHVNVDQIAELISHQPEEVSKHISSK